MTLLILSTLLYWCKHWYVIWISKHWLKPLCLKSQLVFLESSSSHSNIFYIYRVLERLKINIVWSNLKSHNLLNILSCITKVLIIILVLKFGDGKTAILMWLLNLKNISINMSAACFWVKISSSLCLRIKGSTSGTSAQRQYEAWGKWCLP